MESSASDPLGPSLVVATTNPDKIAEIARILAGAPVTIVALGRFAGVVEPVETGATFADNARQKALHYAGATGALVVAEDSGLEIDALDGAPGVHSARFGGPAAADYRSKFAIIYDRLRARGVASSAARFVCALAVARPGAIVFEARGVVEGTIAAEPRGAGGFGYDPIFFYPPFGCTLAEVTGERKAEVSHRGRAFRQLRQFVESGGLGADR